MACRRFDADGSGSISQKEVTQALRSLGVPVRRPTPQLLGLHEHRHACFAFSDSTAYDSAQWRQSCARVLVLLVLVFLVLVLAMFGHAQS